MKKKITSITLLLCMIMCAVFTLTACDMGFLDDVLGKFNKDSHVVTEEQFNKAIAFESVKDLTIEDGEIGSDNTRKVLYTVGKVYVEDMDEYFELMGNIPEYRYYKDEQGGWKRIVATGFELDLVGVSSIVAMLKDVKFADCEYKDEFYHCQATMFAGTEEEVKLNIRLQFEDGQLTQLFSGVDGAKENYQCKFYNYGKTTVTLPQDYKVE